MLSFHLILPIIYLSHTVFTSSDICDILPCPEHKASLSENGQIISTKNDELESKKFSLRRSRRSNLKSELDEINDMLSEVLGDFQTYKKVKTRVKKENRKFGKQKKNRRIWGKWTAWAPCSVTCGKGRNIRWRHCIANCRGVETEMEQKTCQMPACGTKLFGVIKLH